MTSKLLEATRSSLGVLPRRISPRDHIAPPPWMRRDDPLRFDYDRAPALLERGRIVWGCVVQANNLLFEVGDADAPGVVLYGSNPSEDLGIAALERAARAAVALKGTTPVDPSLARVAALLTEENGRHPPVDLPDVLTRGRAMRLAIVMIHRVHLPKGRLAAMVLPLLTDESRDAVTPLPARFWEKDLVRGWVDLGALT